jgi:hypothetical protein
MGPRPIRRAALLATVEARLRENPIVTILGPSLTSARLSRIAYSQQTSPEATCSASYEALPLDPEDEPS